MTPKIDDFKDKPLVPLRANEKGVDGIMGWTDPANHPSFKHIQNHVKRGGNVGMAVPEGMIVLDVDIKNGKVGAESFERLENIVGAIDKTVLTPSGGWHCYLTIPKGLELRAGAKKDYKDIDFQMFGTQVLIPGCSIDGVLYDYHPENFMGYDEVEASDKIITELFTAKAVADDDFADIETESQFDKPTIEQVKECLSYIDNNGENLDWVKVGMAIHSEYPGDDGLELFEEWSIGGDTYKERECSKRWRSFKKGSTSYGTIVFLAEEGGMVIAKAVEAASVGQVLRARIEQAEDLDEIRFDIVQDILKEDFDKVEQDLYISAIKAKAKTWSHTLTTGACRDMIKPKVSRMGISEAPEWCKRWVYVSSHKAFVDANNPTVICKGEEFNIRMGVKVPVIGEGDAKQSAVKFVSDNGFIESVEKMVYMPFLDDRFGTELDGTRVLNSFNKMTLPKAAESFTDEGLRAIEMLENHIELVCGDRDDAEILKLWLCHNVQFPGRQILWSPLVQSIPGAGKTIFGDLLNMVLNDKNVGLVNPSAVLSEFNHWATGVCVNVLEELKVSGHNRYETLNKIKPLITDQYIQINDKGVRPYKTQNTCNYFANTNFRDALPLELTDRRWFVIHAPFDTLDDVTRLTGVEFGKYFEDLFEAVRGNPQEIRKWMLEYPIPDAFKSTKQAPMTRAKERMVAGEEDKFEGFTLIQEIISTGETSYVNDKCISVSDLFLAVDTDDEGIKMEFNARTKANVLMRIGYLKHPKKVKIDGHNKTVWTRHAMTNDEIRESFKR